MKHIFKRSTAWMLTLALLLGLFAGVPGAVLLSANAAEDATVEEKNLLADYNASFEDIATPNWTLGTGANQSRDKASDGNAWSLKISVKDAAATSDAVAIAAGYTYTAAAKLFGAGKITVVFYDANGNVIGEESAEGASTQWEDLKVEAMAPAGAVKAAVKLAATTDAAVYFDNASLVRGAAFAPDLKNPSFDQWATNEPPYWTFLKGEGYALPAAEEVEGRGNVLTFNREDTKMQFYSHKFDVIGGMSYDVTMDVFTTAGCTFYLYLHIFDADGNQITTAHGLSSGWGVPYASAYATYGSNFPTNEWTQIYFNAVLPANAAQARVLVTTSTSTATCTMKFDNVAVTAATEIFDGGYENGPLSVGVANSRTKRQNGSGAFINTDAAYVKEGAQSFASCGSNHWFYSNAVSVIPGETYSASVYMKSTADYLAGAEVKKPQYYFYFYDAAGNVVASKSNTSISLTNDWQEIVLTQTAPENAAFVKTLIAPNYAVFYADSETITKTTAVADGNMLANADFEDAGVKNHSLAPNWSGTQYYNTAEEGQEVVYFDAEQGNAMHIAGSGATLWLASKRFPAVEGETYTASAKFAGTAGYAQLYLRFAATESTGAAINPTVAGGRLYGTTADFTADSTGWIGISDYGSNIKDGKITLTVPEGAAWVYVLLVAQPETNEANEKLGFDMYFDDVVLYKNCEHDFSGDAVVTAPTCGVDGTSVITCPDCGATSTVTTPATGAHTWGEGVVTEPTCNAGGYTTYTCTVCGETKIADQTAAGNHTWNEGVYTDPTTEADGYTTYTCTSCGTTKIETDEGSMLIEVVEIIRNGASAGKYYTIQDALNALQDGDTLELLADIDYEFRLPFSVKDNITFDGNDHTVTGIVRILSGDTTDVSNNLVIKNVIFDGSVLNIGAGQFDGVTIQDCTFQNGEGIKTYANTSLKNITITGCIFDNITNENGTASAIILPAAENITITANDILSVEWNAIQIGGASGEINITDNNITWNARDDADGAYNLNKLHDAKVTISGNVVEAENANAQYPVVYCQISLTDVALILEDDVTVGHNGLFTEVNGNVYCTGHVDVDGVCSICGTASGPATDANLVFSAPGLSFKDYIGMQILVTSQVANKYDRVWIEAVQADPAGDVTTTLEGVSYYYGIYLKFEQQVLSWSMAENITLTLYAEKDGVTVKGMTFSGSVEELALEKIASYAASNNTKAVTALVDMLNYGAAVQTSFNHYPDMLPNTNLGSYTGTTATPTFNATNSITGTGKLTVASNSISMQAKVEIQLLIMGKIDGYTVSATVGGAAAPVVVDTEKYAAYGWTLVKVAVAADKMRQTYTISINDANGTPVTQVYNVSVEAYGQGQLSGARADVVIAMMRYGDSVAAL